MQPTRFYLHIYTCLHTSHVFHTLLYLPRLAMDYLVGQPGNIMYYHVCINELSYFLMYYVCNPTPRSGCG
ncbi:hypothetical protein F5B19DRAFT_476086 [Rostrohypoxylon terebratum]|nr:hypothetical protein F5B19DRAFT_476086 [Rostrohypoxylon terebratum]